MNDIQPLVGRALVGVAAALPANTLGLDEIADRFGVAEARKIAARTGITTRRVAADSTCTSDLCYVAAVNLLEKLEWDPSTIDALVFVSQTPDYVLPATSCVLQGRLGLPKRCAAFDINLGCSGYVYGLWVLANLLNSSQRRAILLVGDTITKLTAATDRSVVPIFGDAGTASALEWTGDTDRWWFELGTDGSGESHLKVPVGGFRKRWSLEAAQSVVRADGNIRSDADLYMNGPEIFAFSAREVAPLVARVIEAASWSTSDVDAYVFHQANRSMLEHLAKKLSISPDRLVLSLDEFGNTSSASIPLALVHRLDNRLTSGSLRLVLAGFGVGFSWAAVAMRAGPLVVPPIAFV